MAVTAQRGTMINCIHLHIIGLDNGDTLKRCKLRKPLDCDNCDDNRHSVVEELTATAKAVVKNPRLAPQLTQRERWVRCKKCKPHYNKNGRCNVCKCFLAAKIALLGAHCPINKW